MQEEWKAVVGYEELYEVSNLGNVKSLRSGRMMKQFNMGSFTNGYRGVALTKDKKTKNFFVHRLVALAFIPNPEGKPQVNHIDGDKKNNYIDNLEWNTNSENQKHSVESGLKGGYEYKKLTREQRDEIRELRRKGKSYWKLSNQFDVSTGIIKKVLDMKEVI